MRRTDTYRIPYFRICFLIALSSAQSNLVGNVNATPIAGSASKFLGNITPGSSTGIPWNFDNYWNQITPENSGKWGYVERTRDSMSWASLDIAYEHTREKGILFKQHTFVWGNQAPNWIDSLTPEEQREEVEEWIQAFAERYPETDMIDVVNEPINTPPSYRDALGGSGETGWDWVVWSFEKARQYCPNAKLLINEYHIVDDADMTARYLQIINILKEKNLIDGIGVQSHLFSVQGVPPETIKSNLYRLAETGLPVYSSELDIAGDDATQLNDYKTIFPIFWEHPAVAGVTIWGWIFNRTWRENTHLINSDSTERPALTWLREYVESHPMGVMRPVAPVKKNCSLFALHNGRGGFLRLSVDRPAVFSLRIVNLLGKPVGPRKSLFLPRGNHTLPLDSEGLPSGAYIVIVEGSGEAERYVWLRAGVK